MRGKKELFRLIAGLVLFMLDIVTDIIVAVEYRRKGDDWWFILTLCFILVPLILVNAMSTYQTLNAADGFHVNLSTCLMFLLSSIFLRFVKEFVQWKRTYSDNIPCGENYRECRCANCIQHLQKLSMSNKSAYNFAWIHYVETMVESAPQWCLQVYIMFRQWYFPWYTVLSAVFSLLSLAWSITALERARATITKKGHDFKLQRAVLFFAYQLLSLFSRLFAVVIFAYVFKMYVILVLVLHWLVVSGIILCIVDSQCDMCSGGCGKCMKGFLPFVYSFPFLFHASKSVLKSAQIYSHTLYYTAYGAISVENFILTITAVCILRPDVAHLSSLGPIALSFVTMGLVFGAVLSVVYYFKYNKPTEEPPTQVRAYENRMEENS